jgi:hypothetical protein
MDHSRIYYSDGSVFDNSDESGLPPAMDAQVIVQRDPDRGWITTHGADFYIWKGGRWWGCEIYGLFRFLMDTGLVLFGETIPHDKFDEIYQQAKAYKLEMAKEQ